MEYPRAPLEVSVADAIWVEFSGLAEGGRIGTVVELVLGGVGGWVAGAGLVGVVDETGTSVVGENVTMSLPVVMTDSGAVEVGSVVS